MRPGPCGQALVRRSGVLRVNAWELGSVEGLGTLERGEGRRRSRCLEKNLLVILDIFLFLTLGNQPTLGDALLLPAGRTSFHRVLFNPVGRLCIICVHNQPTNPEESENSP